MTLRMNCYKKRTLHRAESDFLWGGGYPIRRSGDTSYRMDGDNRTRTYDPLHVKQMLSQLSYISIKNIISEKGLFDKSFFINL